MKNLFFIQQHLQTDEPYDGGIGNKDLERVLIQNGFKAILFPYQKSFSLQAKIARLFFFIKRLISLPADSILVFEWPLYARIYIKLVNYIALNRKSIKLICFISDINGLKDADNDLLENEKKFFKRFNHFIVHNDRMEHWLQSFHKNVEITSIEFFDFLTQPATSFPGKSNNIAFAGNLFKSSFINDLHKVADVQFHLYGKLDVNIKPPENVQYYGIIKPYDLPQQIKGSFGLVWDGDGVDGSKGVFGEYIRYISPHKLSLYILAGLPVIAHTSSATAGLIQQYKIGFVVDSLIHLKDQLNNIPIDEYKKMQNACIELAKKISSGGCLTKAIKDLI